MSAEVVHINERVPVQPQTRAGGIMPTTFPEVIQMAEFLARSGMVPSAMRNKPADIAAILLKGAEIGVFPMTALAQIVVIEGKPSVSPELMRALATRAGHRITFVAMSDTSVTVRGVRGDNGESLEITWDMARAAKAKLNDKGTWKTYPQAMLVARSTSELVRYLFPDLGIGYIPEELGATVDENGNVIDVPSQFNVDEHRAPEYTPEQLAHLEAVKSFIDDIKVAGLGANLRAWGEPLGYQSWVPDRVSVAQLAAAVQWANSDVEPAAEPGASPTVADPIEAQADEVPLMRELMTPTFVDNPEDPFVIDAHIDTVPQPRRHMHRAAL